MRYYRTAISNGIFLLPLIALIPLIPYYIRHRKRGIANPLRLLTFYGMILYLLVCWYFVVLPLPSEEWLATIQPAGVNLMPFSYFRDLSDVTGFDVMERSTYFSAVGSSFALQYWFNILMLVPLGMYLRYIFHLKAGKTALISLAATVFFEVTQLTGVFGIFSKAYRSFDVDDIICNFIGSMLGYWLMGRLAPLVEKIEVKAAEAYRNGKGVSVLRRGFALALDAQIVYVINLGLKMIPGLVIIHDDLYVIPLLLAEMFVYTFAATVLFKGCTVGKWLMHLRVRSRDEKPASRLQLLARYGTLYLALILFSLAPAFATMVGLPETAVQQLSRVLVLMGAAIALFHIVAAWMFPVSDYPWGGLSGTRVFREHRTPRAAQNA